MAKRYTQEEKERGFMALVLANGSCKRASRDLEAAGHPVPPETLHYWKKTRADEIDVLAHEMAPKLKERRARAFDDLAVTATEAAKETVELAHSKIHELDARDLPGAARNFSTTAAIATDKAQILRGEDRQQVKVDITASLNFLKRTGVLQVEAEDVEVKDAKEIEG